MPTARASPATRGSSNGAAAAQQWTAQFREELMTPAPGTICGPDEYETDDSVLERERRRTKKTGKEEDREKKTATKKTTTPRSRRKGPEQEDRHQEECGEQETPMNGDDLRARLAQGTPVLMPGVWDALSARLVVQAGFDTAFVSGFCVSGTRLGVPDFGYLTQTEMAETGARVTTAAPELMVLIDADTGYGNALNVRRTVELYETAGAVGLFLEDQVWPKKCGHMAGKQVVPRDEWLTKLRAAVDSRTHLHITARTDARAAVDLADAIDRAKAAADLGVDALFVEAPQSMAELEQIARELVAVRIAPRRQHDREGPDALVDAGRTARPRLLAHRHAPVVDVRRHESHARRARRAPARRHDPRQPVDARALRRVRGDRRPRRPLRPRSAVSLSMMGDTVRYEVVDHVATITYNRPERLNAINGEMRADLNATWERFRDDNDAWVAIVTGAGRAFCAGADLKDGAGSTGDFPATFWEIPTINSFESGLELFKPTIAAVNGPVHRLRADRRAGL